MQEITLPASMDSMATASSFVEEYLESVDCNMKASMQIMVALDEIANNIVSYAYPDGKGSFTLQLDTDPSTRLFSLTFLDQGVPYNPLEKDDPDISLSAEDRPIGGLGIFMVKKSMDDIRYCYRDGSNCLTIEKHI